MTAVRSFWRRSAVFGRKILISKGGKKKESFLKEKKSAFVKLLLRLGLKSLLIAV